MDITERIKLATELLAKHGLDNGRKRLISLSELNVLLSATKTKIPDHDIHLQKICRNFTLTGLKASFINKHGKSYEDKLAYVKDDAVYITIKFFTLLHNEVVKVNTNNTLSEDEADNENQGFVYLKPNEQYDIFVEKFEKMFGNPNNNFAFDKVQLKNVDGFKLAKSLPAINSAQNYPKKLKILIEKELTIEGIAKPIKYHVLNNGYEWEKYDFEIANKNTTLSFKPKGYEFDDDDKIPKMPLSALIKSPSEQLTYHVYEGKVVFENNETFKMQFQSFVPLRQTYYEAYGYIRSGLRSKMAHLKIFQIVESSQNNIKTTDIFKGENHAFIELYDFLFEHVRRNKIPMKKKKSDTIFWMETNKTLIQFSGFDIDRTVHGIYAGFQDVGKSYILNKFNAIKFANYRTTGPSNMTIPGLFGGSNQELNLPDTSFKAVPIPGAFAADALVIEEIGKAIRDKQSVFNNATEDFKKSLIENKIENIKVGGATDGVRRAYLTMTMNYDKEWLDSLRFQLRKIMESVEQEWNKNQIIIGEQSKNLLGEEGQVQSGILRELCDNYDIFLPFDEYPEAEFEFNDRKITRQHALLFKEGISRFRENYKTKDIHTDLANAFIKRLPYSLYGSTEETKVEQTRIKNVDNFGILSISSIQKEKDLFIPNLQDVIQTHIQENAEALGYVEGSPYVAIVRTYAFNLFDMFAKKYPKLIERIGPETLEKEINRILITMMFANGEAFPSLLTLQLVEKWAYLQCTPITSKQAKNYIHLERKVKYIFTAENYDKLKEDLAK